MILVAAVAGVSAASAADAKHRPTIVRLHVPDPGHVTLEVAKVRLTGKNVAKFKLPRRFRLVNGAAFPGAVAMVAANVRRRKAAETVTVVAVVVNAGSGSTRSLAALRRSAVSAASVVKAGSGDVQLGDGQDDTWDFVFDAAVKSGFASNLVQGRLLGLGFTTAIMSGGDGMSPDDEARFMDAMKKLYAAPDKWDPNVSKPNVDTGHYDDGHAFGWKKKDSSGVQDGLKVPTTAQQQMPDLVAKIYADAGARLPLYQYSFSGLSATIDPGAGGIPPFTETFSGTACGAHAVTAPWTITISIPPDAPQTIPGVDLSDGAPTPFVTNTTKQNGTVVGTATSTLQVVTTGGLLKTDRMELNVTTTGTERVSTTVPADATITATRAASC